MIFAIAVISLLFLLAGPSAALDTDGDGVEDAEDNCTTHDNGPLAGPCCQIDTDGDGLGNACDADYNQTGDVNTQDYLILAATFDKALGDPGYNPNVDCNGTDSVNIQDYLNCFATSASSPGPSGLACSDAKIDIAGSPPDPVCSADALVADIISVKDHPYDALGDGVADDRAAIQATIDAADGRGAQVFIPQGTYRILAPLRIPRGLKVVGASRESSVIQIASTTLNAVELTGAFIEIRSLTIDRDPNQGVPTAGSGIALDGTTGWQSVFRDLIVSGHFDGISTTGSLNGGESLGSTTFSNVVSRDNVRYGWHLERARGTYQSCFARTNGDDGFHVSNASGSAVAGMHFLGGTAWNNGGAGMAFESDDPGSKISDVIVVGFVASRNNSHGIRLLNHGLNFQMSGVFTEHAGSPPDPTPPSNIGHGLQVGGNVSDVVVQNLQAYLNSYCGIEVVGNGGRVTITGAHLYRNGRAPAAEDQCESGIRIHSSSDVTLTNSHAWEEPSDSDQKWGVEFAAGSDHLIVTRNNLIGNETGAMLGSPGTSSIVANNLE